MENSYYLFDIIARSTNDWLAAIIIGIIPLLFALGYALVAIYGELKISAFMQDKLGPMRTGPYGLLQPIAECVKLLEKEDITPDKADKPLFNLAPYLIFLGSYAAFAVIPWCSLFAPSGLNIGLFFIMAISSLSVIAILMGGWASNNRFSLLGAYRSVGQIVSYEIPSAMAILGIASMAGSLSMTTISQSQSGWFWNWYIFGGPGGVEKIWVIPFTLVMFLIYFTASLAETNRTPFDLPEGESELVAGYHTEYSGMKFAMFYMAEYSNMLVAAAIITVIFLGGWCSPFGDFLNGPIWQVLWFIAKAFFIVFIQIWVRWTLPRFRVDQVMFVCWKVLLPASMVCFFVMALAGMVL